MSLSVTPEGSVLGNEEPRPTNKRVRHRKAVIERQQQRKVHIRSDRQVENEHGAQAMAAVQHAGVSKPGFVTEPRNRAACVALEADAESRRKSLAGLRPSDAVTAQPLARVIDMKQDATKRPWTFSGSPADSAPVAAAMAGQAAAPRAGLDCAFGRGP